MREPHTLKTVRRGSAIDANGGARDWFGPTVQSHGDTASIVVHFLRASCTRARVPPAGTRPENAADYAATATFAGGPWWLPFRP
jgi:hypothetical protein